MPRILIIEDDLPIRENVAEILELAGFETITSQNGREGLARARNDQPDLVLCDIMMPEMDGVEVLALLKRDKSTNNLPLVFMSAKSEMKEVEAGVRAGAAAYITKPFDAGELIQTVKKFLKK
jgi:CheY-like chemotaxis protein